MLIVGLTGGLACGKTLVAQALRDMGAYAIEADDLGHEVLLPSGEAYAPALAAFGSGIAEETGEIDRARLADIVFGDPAKLARLNAIVHPAVRARARRSIDEIAARDPAALIVYVAAILIESGGMEGMSKLVVVTCPREQQIERALERPAATESSVLARLERQMPLAEKVALADYVIDTGGTKQETLRQTKLVFEELRKLAA